MYGEVGTDQIYDSFASKVRLRDQQDLYYNEDIYQTIFPPKQPRLSLADAFSINKQNKRKAPIDELLTTEDKYLVNEKYWDFNFQTIKILFNCRTI